MGRKRSVNRSTVNCLYSCLMLEAYPHILKWTENEREFSILFKRKGSTGWDISDLDFFKEMDSLSPSKKEKYFNQPDYDVGCKRRCKANLQKMCNDKVLEFVHKESIDKSTKFKYYKFLEIPNVEDIYKYLPVTKKRGSNENIDVINKKARCNSPNSEENNNEKMVCSEEFRENNNAYFKTSDTYELPEQELSNLNEFLQIKASLPGYFELPKTSLTQGPPLWSNYFTPQIKIGMNIEEVVNIL